MTNLKDLRLKHGLTQKQLAKMLRLTVGELSKLENAWYARIPVRIGHELLKVFGAGWSFESLMQEAPTPTPPGQAESPGDSEAGELRKAS